MGLRGPPPIPTVVNILNGNPSRRPLNTEEPKPRENDPQMPADLDEDAQKLWDEILPILNATRGLITEADGLALGNLCRMDSRRKKAQAELDSGLLYQNAVTGVAHVNPAFQIVMNCERQILTLMREFGLTPAARTRIRVEKSDSKRHGLEEELCG